MRLHQPTGFLLLFWPCSFGIAITKQWNSYVILLPLFFVGSIIMRSAGCIINDIIDKDIDKLVKRTKTRPLASGNLSIKQALVLLALLLSIGALILLSLNRTSIFIGLCSIILISLYPFMKRWTNYPQAFLGITFSIGALIGYASAKNSISLEAILIYIACCFWTLGYDTIYGYQDYKDDKKYGIKSTAISFERNNKLFIGACYCTTIVLISLSGIFLKLNNFFYLCMFVALCQLSWQVYSLNIKDSSNCFIRFNSNKYLGLIIFLGLIGGSY